MIFVPLVVTLVVDRRTTMKNLLNQTKPYQNQWLITTTLLLVLIGINIYAITIKDRFTVNATAIIFPLTNIFISQAMFTMKVQKDVLLNRIPHNEAAMSILKEYKKS